MPARPEDEPAPRPSVFAPGPVFEQAGDAMAIAHDDGTLLHWNAAAARLFGLTEAEARGRNLVDVFDAMRLRLTLRALEFGGRAKPADLPARHADGRELWTETTLTRFLHEGEPRLLVVARDASRRALGREEDARHIRRLEDAVSSLEAFTYVVSHDLKEPVRAMGTYLEEALEDPAAPEREDYLRRAAAANRNLDRLLHGLLEWSRTASTPLEPEAIRLQDVLKDPGCAAQFASLVEERGARLEVSPAIPPVLATESLLCRVFGNLITNAVRHNPRPHPFVRVADGQAQAKNEVRILVEDDGPGIPDRVKDLFGRLPGRPATLKGGFGLAITRRAVERLNGRMTVEDRPGGGTRFVVDLPAASRISDLEQRVRELV